MTPEIWADLFRQLAFISALVGGFAFAFLGTLLTLPSRSRIVDWTAGMALVTAAGLIICVIGWTLMASQVLITASLGPGGEEYRFPAAFNSTHSQLSQLFIVEMFFFLASLGLSGWVRSRTLGIVSSIVALVAAVILMFVISPFLH